jgi:hypothetical protein
LRCLCGAHNRLFARKTFGGAVRPPTVDRAMTDLKIGHPRGEAGG